MKELDFTKIKVDVIKSLRGDKSQNWLSLRMGYDFNQVSRWENDSRKFKWSDLIHMCSVLKNPAYQSLTTFYKSYDLNLEDTSSFLEYLIGDNALVKVEQLTGISTDRLGRWMNGKAEPVFEDVLKIQHHFKQDTVDFLAKFIDLEKIDSLNSEMEIQKSRLNLVVRYPILNWLNCYFDVLKNKGIAIKDVSELSQKILLPQEDIEAAVDAALEESFFTRDEKGNIISNPQYLAISLITKDDSDDITRYWIDQAHSNFINQPPSSSLKNRDSYAFLIASLSDDNWKKVEQLRDEFIHAIVRIGNEPQKDQVAKVINLQLFDLLDKTSK